MNSLILNNRIIHTDRPASITLLDFVRYEQHLRGTKIGCREGDCGACTVLIGSLEGEVMKYSSVTSCIAPLGNAFGKHIVTIDGLKMPELSPVQSAIVDQGGTQCGFCTPGFAVSLTGYCISCEKPNLTEAIAAVDGNICRCTGYKSIERGIDQLVSGLKGGGNIKSLVKNKYIPDYFLDIPTKIQALPKKKAVSAGTVLATIGGGTDLYVQRPEELAGSSVQLISEKRGLKGIKVSKKTYKLGASTTATEIMHSPEMNDIFPNLKQHLKLVSSTQIRNMGTVGGNFVNASPIGDLTIFFLALDASLNLRNDQGDKRTIALRDFYKGYKKVAKKNNELIETIEFAIPDESTSFNFEKVCKRTHLDIASVNSAMQITVSDNTIESVNLSAGGVGPIPTYLKKTVAALTGESLAAETIKQAATVLADEIAPISDARGTAEYKSLLLRQLFFAHFLELFPKQFTLADLT